MAFDGHKVSLSNVTATSTGSANQTADYVLTNGGDVTRTNNNVSADVGDWITPKDSFANYEVRATLNSGGLTSGTTGSWLNLGTTRSWACKDNIAGGGGTMDANLTIEIRHKNQPGRILATATVILHAERT